MFFFWWRSSRHFVCRFILDGMVKEILTRGVGEDDRETIATAVTQP